MKNAGLQNTGTGAREKANFTAIMDSTLAGLLAFAAVCAVLLMGVPL